MPLILITAVLTISALYVPQPLLPVLAHEFDVSREMVAMLTAVVFIPLSLAPLVYGYILEAVSARRMLRTAMLLLGLASLAICLVDSFTWMMIWRVVQGLLIPATLRTTLVLLRLSRPPLRRSPLPALLPEARARVGFPTPRAVRRN